mgnify:CR=1 FL=1
MSKFSNIPIEQAIELYYQKHHAIQHGQLETLIALKRTFPEIFDKKFDTEIRDLVLYAKKFEQSARYKELRKSLMLEKLFIVPKHNETEDPA